MLAEGDVVRLLIAYRARAKQVTDIPRLLPSGFGCWRCLWPWPCLYLATRRRPSSSKTARAAPTAPALFHPATVPQHDLPPRRPFSRPVAVCSHMPIYQRRDEVESKPAERVLKRGHIQQWDASTDACDATALAGAGASAGDDTEVASITGAAAHSTKTEPHQAKGPHDVSHDPSDKNSGPVGVVVGRGGHRLAKGAQQPSPSPTPTPTPPPLRFPSPFPYPASRPLTPTPTSTDPNPHPVLLTFARRGGSPLGGAGPHATLPPLPARAAAAAAGHRNLPRLLAIFPRGARRA